MELNITFVIIIITVITSLLAFNNVKGNKPGVTLLSYLIEKIYKNNPKSLSFALRIGCGITAVVVTKLISITANLRLWISNG